jgi:hypothetical protein
MTQDDDAILLQGFVSPAFLGKNPQSLESFQIPLASVRQLCMIADMTRQRAASPEAERKMNANYTTMFENCGQLIAVTLGGRVVIRCPSQHTDIRDDESLCDFESRHGGAKGVADYLSACLQA